MDLARERRERAGREETTNKSEYKTDGGTDDDDGYDVLALDADKCTSKDDCGCFRCESYKSDYDSGDAEDDKDKTVNRVNRVRYDYETDKTDDGDDVESSDSEFNDEDLAGWGFTTDEDD